MSQTNRSYTHLNNRIAKLGSIEISSDWKELDGVLATLQSLICANHGRYMSRLHKLESRQHPTEKASSPSYVPSRSEHI